MPPPPAELRCASEAAAARAFALGYATVCLETRVDARRVADASPAAREPRDVAAPAGTPRLRLLRRLTLAVDGARLQVPKSVRAAFDVIAAEPATEAAFAAACACADVDVVTVAAARRAPFSLARAPVSAARARGATFEVAYGPAVANPRTLRHLVATARRGPA